MPQDPLSISIEEQPILGMDVSIRSLEIASKRLKIDNLSSFQAERIKLIHGSLMYRDKRLAGFDAASVVEVIEHLDPPRLSAFEPMVHSRRRRHHWQRISDEMAGY